MSVASPVHDAVFVQVIHRREDLAGVAPHLPLLQPLPLTDPIHQVSSGAELHGHVVAVLCLQSLTRFLITDFIQSAGLFNLCEDYLLLSEHKCEFTSTFSYLEQDHDVWMSNHLMNPRFPLHVLQHIRVLSRFLFVNHLDGHLKTHTGRFLMNKWLIMIMGKKTCSGDN